MHRYDAETEALSQAILEYAQHRLRLDPVPLDGPRTPAELDEVAGADHHRGRARRRGGAAAVRRRAGAGVHLGRPPALPVVHPVRAHRGELAVRPRGRRLVHLRRARGSRAPGRCYAENAGAALGRRPRGPAARGGWRLRPGRHDRQPVRAGGRAARGPHGRTRASCRARWKVAATDPGALLDQERLRRHGRRLHRRAGGRRGPAHRRRTSAATLDAVGTDGALRGRRDRGHDQLRHRRRPRPRWPRSAPSSASGSTSTAPTAARGWRARASGDLLRRRSSGRDSFIVDPHKWLFAPFDCCALLYRDPALARAAHTQNAGYLDVLTERADWNPSDYAVGLTRRARGPAVLVQPRHARHRRLHRGHRAHAGGGAVRRGGDRAAATTSSCCASPTLSVVVFRRHRLDAAAVPAVVGPAAARRTSRSWCRPSHEGETVTRFAIVNPRTTEADISHILDTMA